MKLGLNIGCGKNKIPSTAEIEWVNIDADYSVIPNRCMDAWNVSTWYVDKADEIVANDILEHIPYAENDKIAWKAILRLWVSCLRPGGTIRVQVPSAVCCVQRFLEGAITEKTMNRVIYGESTTAFDKHYQTFTLNRLRRTMEEMGLQILDAH